MSLIWTVLLEQYFLLRSIQSCFLIEGKNFYVVESPPEVLCSDDKETLFKCSVFHVIIVYRFDLIQLLKLQAVFEYTEKRAVTALLIFQRFDWKPQ